MKLHRWYLEGTNGRLTRGQRRNIYFVKTGFTGHIDVTVARYSATNNGLPASNSFCFQRNVVEVNHMRVSLCMYRFLLSHIQIHVYIHTLYMYMRNNCDRERKSMMKFWRICMYSTPVITKISFWNAVGMHVCIYVSMCTPLSPEWLEGLYSYSIIRSLCILGRCPVNLDAPILKIGRLQIGPKTQNSGFLKNNSNYFDYISVI
jgi:hypothetical protein